VVIEQPAADGLWPGPPAGRTGLIAGRVWIIKRVVAVPGDPVPSTIIPALANKTEYRVPAGCIVLLGDNPRDSLDSRSSGYYPLDRVLGSVVI